MESYDGEKFFTILLIDEEGDDKGKMDHEVMTDFKFILVGENKLVRIKHQEMEAVILQFDYMEKEE